MRENSKTPFMSHTVHENRYNSLTNHKTETMVSFLPRSRGAAKRICGYVVETLHKVARYCETHCGYVVETLHKFCVL
jgi:hypothetical protein